MEKSILYKNIMTIRILNALPENALDIFNINSLTWLHTYKSEKYGIDVNLVKKYPTSDVKKSAFIDRKSKEIQENPGSYIIVNDNERVI